MKKPSKPKAPAAPVQPITQTLSESATAAVLEMRQATGREVEDIINGILVGEIGNAMSYADQRQEDGWNITAEQIEDAARERLECEEKAKGEVQAALSAGPLTSEPSRQIVLELSPGAYASLVILKEYEGHASIEDAILETVMRMGVQSLFQQVLGNEKDPTMAKWFGLPDDEQED